MKGFESAEVKWQKITKSKPSYCYLLTIILPEYTQPILFNCSEGVDDSEIQLDMYKINIQKTR